MRGVLRGGQRRPHRVARRVPAEMLAGEASRLPPGAPFTAALGVIRRVGAMSLVAFEGGQYPVPHQLAGEVVHVRPPPRPPSAANTPASAANASNAGATLGPKQRDPEPATFLDNSAH